MLQIKRWYLMLTGKSIWHVNQDIGKCFQKNKLEGYYNNLTEKVTKMPDLLESDALPLLDTDGKKVEMPVAIFQFGLGAYDMFLQTNEAIYHKKFMQTVKWAMSHQDEQGRWDTFFYVYPEHPYGAMSQGEGASLLLRAYANTGKREYLDAAHKAIDFMLLPIEEGGTTKYEKEDVVLAEYTHLPIVMNGWVFAWWGLYDYVLVTKDEKYKIELDKSCETLERHLPMFNTSYWSKYDEAGMMASPFYHNLHVAQMQAMYILTGKTVFNQYAIRWGEQQKNLFFSTIAFVKKAFQKILE